MKKSRAILIKIILTPIIILTVHYLLNFYRIQTDGWRTEIKLLIKGEKTHYPDKYSDRKFLQIKNGMTERELFDLLGQPLRKFPQKDTVSLNKGRFVGLIFSERAVPRANYRIRIVYTDRGFVTGTYADLDIY